MNKNIFTYSLSFLLAICSNSAVSQEYAGCPKDSWESDEGKCIKLYQKDIELQKLEGYDSCVEMKEQLFGNEDGAELVSEDMLNFGRNYRDLQKALQICELPNVPEYYFDLN
jgi:hypothetical protein